MKLLIPAACIAATAAAVTAAGAAPADGRAAAPAGGRAAPRQVIPLPELLDPQALDVPRRCPVAMRGVDLDLQAVPGGVVLEFTSARRRQVPGLREQLREAALAIEQYSKAPLRLGVVPVADGEGGTRLPPLDISVNNVGAGARVVIRAQRARDLPELLELARTFEILWSRSDCNEDVYVRARAGLPYLRA